MVIFSHNMCKHIHEMSKQHLNYNVTLCATCISRTIGVTIAQSLVVSSYKTCKQDTVMNATSPSLLTKMQEHRLQHVQATGETLSVNVEKLSFVDDIEHLCHSSVIHRSQVEELADDSATEQIV